MPGHERRRTRPPEHKSLAVKKGYTQNPLAAAKARAAAAEAAEPKKAKKAIVPGSNVQVDDAVDDADQGDKKLAGKSGEKSGGKSGGKKAPKSSEPPRDSTGQLYITLAQALKKYSVAATGGAAKHAVRAGGITVNGTPEDRPGRKLHAGDIVIVGDQTVTVDLMP